jgi:hypothetical protein
VRERTAGAEAPDQRIEQLERIGRLRDSGVLDADEFAAQKAAILADDTPTEPNGAAAPPTATAPQP